MYKGFVLDWTAIEEDEHLAQGCAFCHGGDEAGQTRDEAHKNLVKRPSDDPDVCGQCHEEIADTFRTALHYTAAGLKHGVRKRFSEEEKKRFDTQVFEQSCRTCHASCGDCHVKGPRLNKICTGLLKGHRFVKGDTEKTCGFCHAGRVYPEYTGQYGVVKDVHMEKGMMCLDCHKKESLHGDGTAYASRRQVKAKPACADCHPFDETQSQKARQAHEPHEGILTCTACHAISTYKQCTGCHLGAGGKSKSGFILGPDPENPSVITTLRTVPTVPDTFKKAGLSMTHYDQVPNFHAATPHVIRKQTERTNNCAMCHLVKVGFLTKSKLIPGGAKANETLIYRPKPVPTP